LKNSNRKDGSSTDQITKNMLLKSLLDMVHEKSNTNMLPLELKKITCQQKSPNSNRILSLDALKVTQIENIPIPDNHNWYYFNELVFFVPIPTRIEVKIQVAKQLKRKKRIPFVIQLVTHEYVAILDILCSNADGIQSENNQVKILLICLEIKEINLNNSNTDNSTSSSSYSNLNYSLGSFHIFTSFSENNRLRIVKPEEIYGSCSTIQCSASHYAILNPEASYFFLDTQTIIMDR